jgi:hypothetical protein
MFITFRKKVMKPNPLRGISSIPKNVSAARRIVFSRFHPAVASLQQAWRGRLEIVKEKKKILLILLILSKLKF